MFLSSLLALCSTAWRALLFDPVVDGVLADHLAPDLALTPSSHALGYRRFQLRTRLRTLCRALSICPVGRRGPKCSSGGIAGGRWPGDSSLLRPSAIGDARLSSACRCPASTEPGSLLLRKLCIPKQNSLGNNVRMQIIGSTRFTVTHRHTGYPMHTGCYCAAANPLRP